MMKNPLSILKALLVFYIILLILPYFPDFSTKSTHRGTQLILTPLDIFFPRHWDFISGSKAPGYDFSSLKHPLDNLQHLLNFSLTILFFIGIFRFFKSSFYRHTILLFSLLTQYWLMIVALVYLLLRAFMLSSIPESELPYRALSLLFIRIAVAHILILNIRKLIPETHNPAEPLIPVSRHMRAMAFFSERTLVMITTAYFILSSFHLFDRLGNRLFKDMDSGTLRNLFIVFIELIVFLAYLVIEGCFRTSPFKVLSGTAVISNTATPEPADFGQIVARSFSRLIPLDSISFLFRNGWHDRISGTTVAYVRTENWLLRHCRIGSWAFSLFLGLYIWILIHSLLALNDRSSLHFDLISIAIGSILVLFTLFIFISMWLSAAADHVYTLDEQNITHGRGFLLKSLTIWIPIVNLFTLNAIMRLLFTYTEVFCKDFPQIIKLRKRSGTVSLCFLIFYYFFLWSLVYFFNSRTNNFLAASAILSVGLIICLTALLRFANILGKAARESTIPQKPIAIKLDAGAFL